MKIEAEAARSATRPLYREMRANYRDYFTGGMGAEAVRDLLDAIDLEATAEELREVIATGKGQKRAKAIEAPEGGRCVPASRTTSLPT